MRYLKMPFLALALIILATTPPSLADDCDSNGYDDSCEGFSDIEQTVWNADSGVTVLGSAIFQETQVRLTQAVSGQIGVVYLNEPVAVSSDFSLQFDFWIGGGTGADGLSVALLDICTWWPEPPLFGENGPGVDSLAIEFDTFDNGGDDPDNNHASVIVNGIVIATQTVTVFDLDSAFWIQADVLMHDGLLDLQISAGEQSQVLFTDLSLDDLLIDRAFLAFGARTGGFHNEHYISNLLLNYSDFMSDDCDSDGLIGVCEEDCNDNGLADDCEIADGIASDCNNNGIPDDCDIAGGFSIDDNNNGIPDECESVHNITQDTWHSNIQFAINAAIDGDIVELADGTFTGAGNKNLLFDGKAITVRSASNDPTLCIIDCENNGQGAALNGPGGASMGLEGLTITNAGGPGITITRDNTFLNNCIISNCTNSGINFLLSGVTILNNCTFTGNSSGVKGGGVSINVLSNPIFNNCTFSGNTSNDGGGIAISGGSTHPTFVNCTISGNSADHNGGGIYCFDTSSATSFTNCTISGNTANAEWAFPQADGGGGIFCFNSSPIFDDCTVSGNLAQAWGGGISCWENSNPTIINCTISENTAAVDLGGGGGISCWDNCSPTITNCNISGNEVESDGSGGGIYVQASSSPTITNCLISDNVTSIQAAAIFAFGGNTTITNCTISGNSATQSGVLIHNTTLTNCILRNDVPFEIDDNGNLVVTYSNIQGGWAGVGNIDADPLFEDPDGPDDDPDTWEDNNYHIISGSPCIDAADNTAVPKGVVTDLDGNPRFIDDPVTKDTGLGDPPIVDMGAYEYQALIACPWDLDKSGSVGTGDLLELFTQWGTAGSADFDESGEVGTGDLLVLFVNWGPCE